MSATDHMTEHHKEALAAAVAAGVAEHHLLALARPEGLTLYYGGMNCELCGYSYDEITWHFHGPDSVSWRGSWGCYGGGTGGPATFAEALEQVPPLGDEENKTIPQVTRAHLEELWQEARAELDEIQEQVA